MKQALTDPPRSRREAERRKGPIPRTAIFLVIALAAAFLLYYLPIFAPENSDHTGSETAR